MVSTEGPVEVASQRADGQRGEDRKVDLIVSEMERYNVKVAALQETRWFGSAVCEVGESSLLMVGRERPAVGDSVQRGEGVTIRSSDLCMKVEESRQTVEGMGFKGSVNLSAGGRGV